MQLGRSVVIEGVNGAPVFDAFVAEVRPRLARALVAAYGVERGGEALGEALAYAWERFDEVAVMEHPVAYLFRVGQSRSRPRRHPSVHDFPAPAVLGLPDIEPRLPDALRSLPERQRVAVVLVHGYGWTHAEVAELLGIARTSVQNHLERGLASLRTQIGVIPSA